jgi:hypothetical protein
VILKKERSFYSMPAPQNVNMTIPRERDTE